MQALVFTRALYYNKEQNPRERGKIENENTYV